MSRIVLGGVAYRVQVSFPGRWLIVGLDKTPCCDAPGPVFARRAGHFGGDLCGDDCGHHFGKIDCSCTSCKEAPRAIR